MPWLLLWDCRDKKDRTRSVVSIKNVRDDEDPPLAKYGEEWLPVILVMKDKSRKYLESIEIDTDGNVINKTDFTTPRALRRILNKELKSINYVADEEEQNRCNNILKKRDIFEDFSARLDFSDDQIDEPLKKGNNKKKGKNEDLDAKKKEEEAEKKREMEKENEFAKKKDWLEQKLERREREYNREIAKKAEHILQDTYRDGSPDGRKETEKDKLEEKDQRKASSFENLNETNYFDKPDYENRTVTSDSKNEESKRYRKETEERTEQEKAEERAREHKQKKRERREARLRAEQEEEEKRASEHKHKKRERKEARQRAEREEEEERALKEKYKNKINSIDTDTEDDLDHGDYSNKQQNAEDGSKSNLENGKDERNLSELPKVTPENIEFLKIFLNYYNENPEEALDFINQKINTDRYVEIGLGSKYYLAKCTVDRIYGANDYCEVQKAVPQLYEAILGDKIKTMSKSGTGNNVSEAIPKLLYDGVYSFANSKVLHKKMKMDSKTYTTVTSTLFCYKKKAARMKKGGSKSTKPGKSSTKKRDKDLESFSDEDEPNAKKLKKPFKKKSDDVESSSE